MKPEYGSHHSSVRTTNSSSACATMAPLSSLFSARADAFRDAATAAASAGALEPEASAWFNLAMVQQQLEPGKLVSSVEKGLAVVAKAEEAGEAASVAVVKCELELLKAVAGLYESVVDAAAIDQPQIVTHTAQ